MLSPQFIRLCALYLIALVISICVHEFGHAFVADRLGDRLPRSQGRVTLNPLAHVDPIGTFAMPIAALVMTFSHPMLSRIMIGWGKPVQVSPASFRRGVSMKRGYLLVALAGPMMNILFGLALALLYAGMLYFGGPGMAKLAGGVAFALEMNFMLAVFNLIPCAPLDGGGILAGLLPRRFEFVTDWLNRFGYILLFGLLLTGAFEVMLWPADWAAAHLLAAINQWVGA